MKNQPGRSYPLGATVFPDGVNFSILSKNCSGVELLLFDHADAAEPSRVIELSAKTNRTFYYWHVFVPGLKVGQLYGYRVKGPFIPKNGWRYDGDKVLLDPYGREVAVPKMFSHQAASKPGDNTATAMKSVVADPRAYDWEGDRPLNRPLSRTVIYELHVGGFTRHESSGVTPEKRGTYAGLIEKIPYLQDLGITAVELLPVFQFDPQDCAEGLTNYWGYCPVSFFAPHSGYSFAKEPLGPMHEFRDMVKAFHRAGIEVILDVVFNHTAEGNSEGPTYCFRGLENGAYYILEEDKSLYANYTGCGNTLNANHAIVRRLIMDSLRYWVAVMHVDGFRFDLASVLSRDERGRPMETPPILWEIESDPALAGTKLIAEAWDAAGLYQVGTFVGERWVEWNGKFRDDVRSFFKGDRDTVSKLASRFLASPDLYLHSGREPEQSINFVTCHDGFTLNDLVSYNEKHNEANREGNRDGANDNISWNCGVEGETDDPAIERLRNRQVKNFLTINLISLGVPMLLMGDEVRRSQRGNNNSYCQDNELGWFDWTLLKRHAGLHRFVQKLIALRLNFETSQEDLGLTLSQFLHRSKITWHGVRLQQPDWGEDSHTLAFTVWSMSGRRMFHFMANSYWQPLDFELPPVTGEAECGWRRIIDTFQEAPEDLQDWSDAPLHSGGQLYRTGPFGGAAGSACRYRGFCCNALKGIS